MRKAIEISIENTSEQEAILFRNIIKTHTLDFVNQVEENEAFNPRDKNDLVVADNSWMNKLPGKTVVDQFVGNITKYENFIYLVEEF